MTTGLTHEDAQLRRKPVPATVEGTTYMRVECGIERIKAHPVSYYIVVIEGGGPSLLPPNHLDVFLTTLSAERRLVAMYYDRWEELAKRCLQAEQPKTLPREQEAKKE